VKNSKKKRSDLISNEHIHNLSQSVENVIKITSLHFCVLCTVYWNISFYKHFSCSTSII